MLEVKNFRKVYGESMQYIALKGIDLTVQDGEFVGIMGPSGSGKTTLLNLLATIDQPTSGNILLNGQNPNDLNQEKIAQFRRTQLEIAPRLGIDHLLNKRIAEISGGQAQRVAVARAMVHQPELLLADEPTGNLDTKSSKDVMGLLRQLNQEELATILLVTHDPLAASYCQRIVFIKDGELVHDIQRKGDQKAFYEDILEELARIEGVDNEF